MDYWKKRYMDDVKSSRIYGGTMLFGIITNIIILGLVDSDSCDFPTCDPYLFYLVLSMIIGFIIVKILYKIDPPTLLDDYDKEIPPEN